MTEPNTDRDKGQGHRPYPAEKALEVLVEDWGKLHDELQATRREVERLRAALVGLVQYEQCPCDQRLSRHEPDCPLVAAKQALAPTPAQGKTAQVSED